MNGFKMVGDNVPHILQELFIVVDQGTWSRVQRVAVLSNEFRNGFLHRRVGVGSLENFLQTFFFSRTGCKMNFEKKQLFSIPASSLQPES